MLIRLVMVLSVGSTIGAERVPVNKDGTPMKARDPWESGAAPRPRWGRRIETPKEFIQENNIVKPTGVSTPVGCAWGAPLPPLVWGVRKGAPPWR